jgi:cyclohexa-1,5-dienecarbonyl-CoA hydratase
MEWADGPVRVETLDEGALWRVRLAHGKGNVLDRVLMPSVARVFRRAAGEARLRGVVLEGEGPHFSFGASVEEHLPGAVEGMLAAFRETLLAVFDSGAPVVAALRGQCLGGGLELALACHRLVAAPGARLGQPEVVLGVFAPAASVLLPDRVGDTRAEDLLVTGRTVEAAEALAIGLVDEVADDPAETALAWIRRHLGPRSASSLRLALRAARLGRRARLEGGLLAQERLYLAELMRTRDAEEGLRAFLEKRPPAWSHS